MEIIWGLDRTVNVDCDCLVIVLSCCCEIFNRCSVPTVKDVSLPTVRYFHLLRAVNLGVGRAIYSDHNIHTKPQIIHKQVEDVSCYLYCIPTQIL